MTFSLHSASISRILEPSPQFILKSWFIFSILGWKSKDLKSKGHFKSKVYSKSKGLKAFKGTKAKSHIHKGLVKTSAEPGLSWSWSRGFYWKGHGKGKSLKGKFRICNTVGIIETIRQLEGE